MRELTRYRHMCDSRYYTFYYNDENGSEERDEDFYTKEEADAHIKELEARGCTDIRYEIG